MTPNEYLSGDGLAVLLLCSAFALDEKSSPTFAAPFTLAEWNKLAATIANSTLPSPSSQMGQSASDVGKVLQITPDQAERIAYLLDRASRVTLELESLFSNGMWAVTRVDAHYPSKLRDTLKHQAPSVLFGSGEIGLLGRAGIAVVGSRTIDEAGTVFAQEVGRKTAAAGWPVVSGGAKGTDRLAMQGALEGGGHAFGVLADSLERTIRQADVREFILDGRLVLLTPYVPKAGFSVGAAMGRNKIIYGLADYAVVVSSDFEAGGTWAGAVEAIKGKWCPVFVRDVAEAPKGNRELLKRGALALPAEKFGSIDDLPHWLAQHGETKTGDQDLFGWIKEKSV